MSLDGRGGVAGHRWQQAISDVDAHAQKGAIAVSQHENARTIEAIYAAFGRGDLPRILNSLAEHVAWQHARPDIPWEARDEAVPRSPNSLPPIAEHVHIEQFVPEQVVSRGDQVIVFGHERNRTKSHGRVYETEWVHAWRLEEASVVGFREYTDTATILEALAARTVANQAAE